MMAAWLKKLNRRHLHLSAVAIVALAFLVVIIATIWSLHQYFFWGTNFSIGFVGRDAVLRFSLPDGDQRNLNKLTHALNLDWQGQDLSVELKASDIAKWQAVLPQNSKIEFPSGSEAILHATVGNLPLSPVTPTGVATKFVPQDSLATASIAGIEKLYQLPGKEIFSEISGRPTVALFYISSGARNAGSDHGSDYVQDKLSIALISSVADQAKLDAKLANLVSNSTSPVLGYSSEEEVATGFSEADLSSVKTYTLTRTDLKLQPTFGDFKGHLVVASSPEAWQAVIETYNSGKNIGANSKYQSALASAPQFGAGFLYLDLAALAGRGKQFETDLAPFDSLQIDDTWFETGADMGKLDYLEASWFGLDPIHSGMGQSELWVRLKARN